MSGERQFKITDTSYVESEVYSPWCGSLGHSLTTGLTIGDYTHSYTRVQTKGVHVSVAGERGSGAQKCPLSRLRSSVRFLPTTKHFFSFVPVFGDGQLNVVREVFSPLCMVFLTTNHTHRDPRRRPGSTLTSEAGPYIPPHPSVLGQVHVAC